MASKQHILTYLVAIVCTCGAQHVAVSRHNLFAEQFCLKYSPLKETEAGPLLEAVDTLYRRLVEACAESKNQPENMIVSPVSLYNLLAMVAMGARGLTLEQIEQVTKLQTNNHSWQEQLTKLVNEFQVVESNSTMKRMTNEVLVASEFPVSSDYLDVVTRVFQATIRSADFNSDPEAVRRQFNERTSNFTHGMIKEALPADAISSNTKIIVANAVFFKDDWLHQFEGRESVEPFFIRSNNTIAVSMMHQMGQFKVAYYCDLAAKALLLPFKDNRHGLLIVLPDMVDGLTKLEHQLFKSEFAPRNLLKAMKKSKVSVTLPKFKFNYKTKLNDILREIGIVRLFEPSADLSGMSYKLNPDVEKILEIFHESAMEVDQVGARAAAATDMDNDSIPLFVGHVVDPRLDA